MSLCWGSPGRGGGGLKGIFHLHSPVQRSKENSHEVSIKKGTVGLLCFFPQETFSFKQVTTSSTTNKLIPLPHLSLKCGLGRPFHIHVVVLYLWLGQSSNAPTYLFTCSCPTTHAPPVSHLPSLHSLLLFQRSWRGRCLWR